jgi:hypothetical protein
MYFILYIHIHFIYVYIYTWDAGRIEGQVRGLARIYAERMEACVCVCVFGGGG